MPRDAGSDGWRSRRVEECEDIKTSMCALQGRGGGKTTLVEFLVLELGGLHAVSVGGVGTVGRGKGGIRRLDERMLVVWVVSPEGVLQCCRKVSLEGLLEPFCR